MSFRSNSRRPQRVARVAAALSAGLILLGGCGGGTTQYDPFVAGRVIAFGDESTALASNGHKYAVNGTTGGQDASGTAVYTVNCDAFPNWVQSLAAYYGYVFAECNPNRVEVPLAIMRAVPGAQVAGIQEQVDAQIAAGGFRDKDLVAILAGANDVLALYQQYPGRSEADLTVEARQRGLAMAQQVNRLVGFGAKVIVSTVPDMGYTPYALKQKVEFTDTDRAALLSRLTLAFNEQLGVNILLDGRYVGLVQADLRVQAMGRSPASFGLANASDGACSATVAVPDCTDQTLVEGANGGTWMWADELRMGYPVQAQLASLALGRARGNPF